MWRDKKNVKSTFAAGVVASHGEVVEFADRLAGLVGVGKDDFVFAGGSGAAWATVVVRKRAHTLAFTRGEHVGWEAAARAGAILHIVMSVKVRVVHVETELVQK